VTLMARYASEHGVDLAPHGKTTMAPQLWDRQVRAGAWGVTAATVQQARVMRAVGVGRIMIAGELTDRASLRWIAGQLTDPGPELWSWVDSEDAVTLLERGLGDHNAARPHRVLVELGHRGGRTGCRSVEDALRVASKVADSPSLELAGVAGYEGTVCSDRGSDCLEAVARFVDDLHDLSVRVLQQGSIRDDGEMIVTSGGSSFLDVVVEHLVRDRPEHRGGVRVVIRPGCTLTHDHGFYEERSPFAGSGDPSQRLKPAIELWSSVVSVPEPGLAILGFGRRDAPFDQGMPMPMSVGMPGGVRRDAVGITVERLQDQHAYCRLDDGVDLAVGEIVGCGISHPCTALDKWRVLPVLDDDDLVTEAVATWF
jgi:D-serine deaminase-like pyridoxal phosphate-dependent protein